MRTWKFKLRRSFAFEIFNYGSLTLRHKIVRRKKYFKRISERNFSLEDFFVQDIQLNIRYKMIPYEDNNAIQPSDY